MSANTFVTTPPLVGERVDRKWVVADNLIIKSDQPNGRRM
jgi:hypothetical protein